MASLPTPDSRPTTPFTPFWVAIPDSVLFDPELRATDVRVYAVLKRYALRFGSAEIWPSQEDIAINADCHRTSLGESLAILEERGHIARVSGAVGETDRITILPPTTRPWQFAPAPPPRTHRKQPRRRTRPQCPPLSQNPPDHKTRQRVRTRERERPPLLQKPTSDAANCGTIKDGEKREEKERDARRIDSDYEISADLTYAAWSAFCHAAHLDITAATRHERERSLATARQLLNDGVTVDEIAACTRYLTSQHWRTAPLSLANVAAEIGRWRMAGRPAQAPTPPRPAHRSQADINAPTGQLVL